MSFRSMNKNPVLQIFIGITPYTSGESTDWNRNMLYLHWFNLKAECFCTGEKHRMQHAITYQMKVEILKTLWICSNAYIFKLFIQSMSTVCHEGIKCVIIVKVLSIFLLKICPTRIWPSLFNNSEEGM